jgi:phage tail sheath protein FI
MPVAPSYPGVYIEEIPSGVRTITGVATSITAFIGRALRGPVNKATTINSYGDFERIFGGLWVESTLGYAVRNFYLNGGSQAVIVRLFHPHFASEADRNAALAAAQAVAAAVATAAGDPATVAAAARAEANKAENNAEPRKTAADTVAKAAEAEAARAGATKDTVKDAAKTAADASASRARSKLNVGAIKLEAAYEGKWGMDLRATVDLNVSADVASRMGLTKSDLSNLTVRDTGPGGITESFLNLSVKDSPRRIDNVLKEESKLVRWDGTWPPNPLPDIAAGDDDQTAAEKELKAARDELKAAQALTPPVTTTVTAAQAKVTAAQGKVDAAKKAMVASDGLRLTKADDFTPANAERDKKGLYTLEQLYAKDGLFNLLCIPPYLPSGDVEVSLVSDAAAYCEKRRAMLLVDPRSDWKDKSTAKDKFTDANQDNVGTRSKNAALFFPRLRQPNLLHDNQMEDFVPCGAVAGIFARTDTQRGVWKAPAGLDAALVGVPQLSVPLTDDENGELNPLGINCLRAFPAAGRVVWGSRTLRGADQLADEWKYIPVRRTALFIEESLYRGTQWVVFEPNDEPLWAQIRLNLGAFMHNLFRQGAFQGKTPREAYFVKCDKETTTQNDINLGIVNIVVGFAPLKPAEFVIIKIQQIAGQIQT